MKRKILLSMVALLLAISLVAIGCAAPEPVPGPPGPPGPPGAPGAPGAPAPAPAPVPKPEPIVLNSLAPATDITITNTYPSYWWALERINDRSNGELIINFKGGPEVIARGDLLPACRKGVIDVIFSYGSYLEPTVPESGLINLGKLSPEGYMQPELLDFLRERMKVVGLYFMGPISNVNPYFIFTKEKIGGLSELENMKLYATGSFHIATVEALSGKPVALPAGEDRYTALERGLVDGVLCSPGHFISGKLWEVSSFGFSPPYKTNSNTSMWMSLEAWNKLPTHLQDVVNDVMREIQHDIWVWGNEAYEKDMNTIREHGVEMIEITGTERERYLAIYDDVTWALLRSRIDSGNYDIMGLTPDAYYLKCSKLAGWE